MIVNDMAALNIDTQLVAKANIIQKEEKLVSFENGCICCTLREDLLQEVAQLASTGEFDYLVIESTGISEPMQVAETFTFDLAGLDPSISKGARDLKELSVLDTCVTVVDSSSFDKYFNSRELASDEFTDIEKEDTRSIFHLFTEQIEFADVILLNKCDLVTKADLKRIKGVIRQFNQRADVVETTKSKVDLREVLNTGKFDFDEAANHKQWLETDRYDVQPETEEYGVSSFIFSSERPFNPERLRKVLDDNFILSITNVDHANGAGGDDHDHDHDHDHGEDDDGDEDEEYDEEGDEEAETDE